MYCVRRGLVEVIGDDDITVVATLGPGAYFGEVKNGFVALLPLYDTIRYNTIRYDTIRCHAMPCHAIRYDTIFMVGFKFTLS